MNSRWGSVQVPTALALGPLTTLSAGLGQAPRLGKGISYRPSRKPEQPLEIWCAPRPLHYHTLCACGGTRCHAWTSHGGCRSTWQPCTAAICCSWPHCTQRPSSLQMIVQHPSAPTAGPTRRRPSASKHARCAVLDLIALVVLSDQLVAIIAFDM